MICLLSVLALTISMAYAGYVMWTWTITMTVKEPFEVTHDLTESFTLYAGETKEFHITIKNKASVTLRAKLDWEELDNPNGVDYTITVTPSKEQDIQANSNVTFTIKIDVKSDSPAGTVKIKFWIERK